MRLPAAWRRAIPAAVLLGLLCALWIPASAQETRGDERFPELSWLVGDWQGYGAFGERENLIHRTWSYDLDGMVLVERTLSVFPEDSLTTRFEVHQDTGTFYRDERGGGLKAVWFFVEGYVTLAQVEVEEGGERYHVQSTEIENAPDGLRTRITVARTGPDTLVERFELAMPGRDYALMEEVHLRRVR